MSTVFFFGAGASYGSLDCTPHKPPLGCQLFYELQKAGGVAASIHGQLADLFRREFEGGMNVFFQKRESDITTFLKDIAQYFLQFEPGQNNLYIKLIKALKDTNEGIIFSTINYDLLLDLAALKSGLRVDYMEKSVKTKSLLLFKIHGSCHFLPDLKGLQFGNVQIQGFKTYLEAPVKCANSREEVIEFCKKQPFAPAIALYARPKHLPYCRDFIEKLQKNWQLEVQGAKRIFIIGVSVNLEDEHIWQPLAKSNAWLGYIGGKSDQEKFTKWATKNNKKQVGTIARTFKDAIPLIAKHMKRS